MGVVSFAGAMLDDADMRDANITSYLSNGKSLINFTDTSLNNTDMRDTGIEAVGSYYGPGTIDFSTKLATTNMDGWWLKAKNKHGLYPPPPPTSPAPPAPPPTPPAPPPSRRRP